MSRFKHPLGRRRRSESRVRRSTRSLRRALARLALPVGVVLLVAAPVLRLWVTPALAQAPAVPAASTYVQSGTVTELFDLGSGSAEGGEPIEVSRSTQVEGDEAATEAAAAEGRNVSVLTATESTVTADGRSLGQLELRIAADRHSQALVDCCDAEVAGQPVPMAGSGSPLRLPWLVPAAAYPYFDPVLLRAVEMAYLGTDQINGREAAKFQQATPATALGSVTVPGKLVGSEQETAQLSRVHSVNRTLWVDPTTGVILRSAERVRETLRDDAGRDVVALLAMTLGSTPETEAAHRTLADKQARPVLWAHSYGPGICATLGAALLVAGLAAAFMRARSQRLAEDFPDELATFDDLREHFD